MKKIILIALSLSTFLFANFTKNGDIVTDITTGLQWQDDANAKNVTKTWSEAIEYCEKLTLGGYDDWRLPNINELKSIIDWSKFRPAIYDSFTNIYYNADFFYWSSTTSSSHMEKYAWYVKFYDGTIRDYGEKRQPAYVRCVRTRQ